MMWRKINVKRLMGGGLVYRFFIVICNAMFFATGLKPILNKVGPIGASLCWNAINMCLYYLYHYAFLSLFRMGETDA